ncbi:MAG: hypothetical protein P4L74_01475 [Candidatus Doudnabacteria bacterium]|nr:hypothetical protein [Candidatus Doudnabacteria bacterium]
MILIFHILVALSSLGYTGYVFFSPSKGKLHIAYTLVVLTVISGTFLIVTKPAHMTQTCEEGLAYLAIVAYGIVAARHKLKLAEQLKI